MMRKYNEINRYKSSLMAYKILLVKRISFKQVSIKGGLPQKVDMCIFMLGFELECFRTTAMRQPPL